MVALLTLVAAAVVVGWLSLRFIRSTNFAGSRGDPEVAALTLPPGFQVNVFARGLNGPRFIAFGPDGVLYVADRGNDRIVRLPDLDADGVADGNHSFAEGLNRPHSLIYHEGAWYVGVPTGVVRLRDDDGDGRAEMRDVLIDDYPTGGHSTRTVAFLPDSRMVVSVGSSCNVCEETDPRRAAIVVYEGAEATGERIFASGLRNAVGLAIHPETGTLWASNNGRDLMGDDEPPETIYIVREGSNYGWPVCHSGRIVDPDLGTAGDCTGVASPVAEMQAHSAPLGIAFYPAGSKGAAAFPKAYHGDLFIAFHGSWNRSIPTGYSVVRLPLDGETAVGPVEQFATGWLNPETGETGGRPVGLAIGPDGALYLSDDKAGLIYRFVYGGA